MSTTIHISGWGAVSPAGWSAREMSDAVLAKSALPVVEERRVEGAPLRRTRPVPAMREQPAWARHARLRRSSPAARFAVSAALEALGSAPSGAATGVVFVTLNGSVNFSRRFFAEVIENPLLASPILFPETVFNAPASHLGSLLESTAPNYTLIGDSAQFLGGMDIAAQWLGEGRVERCLVVAAEELDWLSTEALQLMPGRRVASEGAAAVLLGTDAPAAHGTTITLDEITPSVLIRAGVDRAEAARQMRAAMSVPPEAILCDSRAESAAWDAPESAAWRAFPCETHSPLAILGDGFGVSAGWQMVLACELLARGNASSAAISAVGASQQAIGAVLSARGAGSRFSRADG